MKRSSPCTLFAATVTMLLAGLTSADAAQNPQTLFSFCPDGTACAAGANPAGLGRAPDGSLYGVTDQGGIIDPASAPSGAGTAFRLDPLTRRLSLIHRFDPLLEGAEPLSTPTLGPDGNLYGILAFVAGTPRDSGIAGLYRLSLTGEFTMLHVFDGDGGNGLYPYYSPVEDAQGNLYGTTENGGANSKGTIYKLAADGVFTILHSFSGRDGLEPNGLLLARNGNLYGTTWGGGCGAGTAFRITLDGRLTTLHQFNCQDKTDGALPESALVIGPDRALYGSTSVVYSDQGNEIASGTIFRLTFTGQFTTLHTFPTLGTYFGSTRPLTPMPDGYLYGIVNSDSSNNGGAVIFRISPSGDYNAIYSFDNGPWFYSNNPLVRGFGNTLYGTTWDSGTYGMGSVFRYVPPPVQ